MLGWGPRLGTVGPGRGVVGRKTTAAAGSGAGAAASGRGAVGRRPAAAAGRGAGALDSGTGTAGAESRIVGFLLQHNQPHKVSAVQWFLLQVPK